MSHEEFLKLLEHEKQQRIDDYDKIHRITEDTERVTSRMTEDVFESVSRGNKKLEEFEDRLSHLREWVEDLSKCPDKFNVQAPNSSFNPSLVSKSDLLQFEKKLNSKILDSLDETNSIMLKMKAQYKDLTKRVKNLETNNHKASRKEFKREKSQKKLKDHKSQDKIKESRNISEDYSSTKINDVSTNSRRQFHSTERTVQNLVTKIGTNHTADIVRTVAMPKSEFSTAEKPLFDSFKDTKDIELNQQTLKRSDIPENKSKEFTDFMTFEDQNSSDIFELSENDTSHNMSRTRKNKHKRSSSRLSKGSSHKGKENVNTVNQKRSRVQEFESLRKKGSDWLPKTIKSRSNSKSTKGSRHGSKKKNKSSRKSKVTSNRSKHLNI